MRILPRERYTTVAPFYDLLSAEWPVYRPGRVAGIGALKLSPGDRVLDVGCGTGLSFPLLRRSVGASGLIVGVDASAAMLRAANRRTARQGWQNVELVHADATHIGRERLDPITAAQVADGFDAVLFVYSLSLIADWAQAWAAASALLRPGGRAVIVDMQLPNTRIPGAAGLAGLACRLGGADIDAHPWTALEKEAEEVIGEERRGGHVQIRAGRLAPGARGR